LSIYINSRVLKIESTLTDIELLDGSTIHNIKEDDILICTGTVRDDIILRTLVDKKIIPFIITFTKSPKVSIFLENLSLIIDRDIETITPNLIKEIIEIKNNISLFEEYSNPSLISINREIETLIVLSLYQQMQLFNSANYFKSATPTLKRRDIYLDIKKNSKNSTAYIILHDDTKFRVFKIEKGLYKGEDEARRVQERKFLINSCDSYFEALIEGQQVSLKNRKFSFEYIDITKELGDSFLLFGIDDKSDFLTYSLYDIENPKRFKHMAIYDIKKMVKAIDDKAELALFSLKSLLNNSSNSDIQQKIWYRNLDIFLFSARKFKSVISSIKYEEQASFKRTVISDMFTKIYENIIEKRELSQLRFALVALLSSDFDKLNNKIHSHIFYDITNGININNQILKSIGVEINKKRQESKNIQTEFYQELVLDENIENPIDEFIKKNDENRFIEIFLNSILSMNSTTSIDREKTLLFVALVSYITSTNDIKITIKNSIEKIQIKHDYLFMVSLQVTYNINIFFIYIDDFVNLKDKKIDIEAFLNKKILYRYLDYKKDECIFIKIWKRVFSKKRTSLRKMNSQFSNRLLIVGLFYKFISKQKNIDDIISNSFQKIRHNTINIELCCKEMITIKFLSIFFKGNRKKECEVRLKHFFETNKFFLKF